MNSTPSVHYPCGSRSSYCFGARFCFCGAHRSRGLLFRWRLAFVLWLRSPLGFFLKASKHAPFALCPFAARFAFCLSVCALSFRCSVSCFACCPAASRVWCLPSLLFLHVASKPAWCSSYAFEARSACALLFRCSVSVFCLSVCALSFRRSVSCFAYCLAASCVW